MIVYTPPAAAKAIPVVDLLGNDVPREIHKACRETGFFYVANHGVPQPLVDAQFSEARRFFALPLERKLALHVQRELALERQREKAPRLAELRVDQRLRHAMVGDVEEPGLAAGLVNLARNVIAEEIDHRDGLRCGWRRVDDHVSACWSNFPPLRTAERLYPAAVKY